MNPVFVFWFNVVSIMATIISVFMAVWSCKNARAARNYEKLTKVQKALTVYNEIQDIINSLICGKVCLGINYSLELKTKFDEMKKNLYSKSIKHINKIIKKRIDEYNKEMGYKNNKIDFQTLITSINLELQLFQNNRVDKKYFVMQSCFEDIQTYLKVQEENCKGKIY